MEKQYIGIELPVELTGYGKCEENEMETDETIKFMKRSKFLGEESLDKSDSIVSELMMAVLHIFVFEIIVDNEENFDCC